MFNKKVKIITDINLPDIIKGLTGIFAVPVNILSPGIGLSETVLCLQDNQKNIFDLEKIKNPHLHVKVGGVHTPYGAIIFMLFIFWDIRNENDKFTYEVLLNPSDINSYGEYIKLDTEHEWKVLITFNNKVLNIFKFKNIYKIGNSIKDAISINDKSPCVDFKSAKKFYFDNYDISDLIK